MREWREDDLDAWSAMCADERVMEFLGPTLERAKAVADAAMLQAKLARDGFGWWVLEAKEGPPFAGLLALQMVIAMTARANLRSQRVMERLGMHRDPRDDFEYPRFAVGHPLRPSVLFRIGRAEMVRS